LYNNFVISALTIVKLKEALWTIFKLQLVLHDLNNIEIDRNNFLSGYLSTDINGEVNVDLLDLPIVENNINSFIFSIHP
jgi:hypothetical protein